MFTFNSDLSKLKVEKGRWSHSFSNIHSQPSALHFHWSASHIVYILVYLCRQCEIKQLSHSVFDTHGDGWSDENMLWDAWQRERVNKWRKMLSVTLKDELNWDLMKVLVLVPLIIITLKFSKFIRTWLFWMHIVFRDTSNHY